MSDHVAAAGSSAGVARAEAAVHGPTVVCWWSAGILVLGALVTALLFERDRVPAALPMFEQAC